MPIKYVQTLGAVAGIPQTVNAAMITCTKPQGIRITGAARFAVATAAARRPAVAITVKPTLFPNYGGD